jgi:hypothetical protein
MRNLTIACVASIVALASTSARAAGPDPAGVYVSSVSYGGSGCPQGTVGQSISDDRTIMTLIFDDYVASVGPGVPVSENRKECALDVVLHTPPGWQYSVASLTDRGYVQLDQGVAGVRETTVYVDGQATQGDSVTRFLGPDSRDYLALYNAQPSSWSTCGSTAATSLLTVITDRRLSLDDGAAATAQGLLTMDSFDGQMTTNIGLVWQPCVPPRGPGSGAAPDPSSIYIESASFGGTGCPQGTVGQTFSGDHTLISLLFDQFIAKTGAGTPVTESRKTCQINLNLAAPAGWAYTLTRLVHRGYVQLEAGQTGTQSTSMFFESTQDPVDHSHVFNGPIAARYVDEDALTNINLNSDCGANVIPINLQTHVQIDGPAGANGLMTVDALDVSLADAPGTSDDFEITWRQCELDCPMAQMAECTSPAGATVSFGDAPLTFPFAEPDPEAPPPELGNCAPASGSTFALGTTTDTCSLRSIDCSFSVTVVDTTPPTFDAASLAPQTLPANSTGAPIAFAVPTATDTCGPATVTCASLPGNHIGPNSVPCTATDAAGNTAHATSIVTLLGSADLDVSIGARIPLVGIFSVTVHDAGPLAATGVSLHVQPGIGIMLSLSSGSGWTCGAAGGGLTCTRPSVAVGASASIGLLFIGLPGPVTATVTATTPDPNLANNTASRTFL